MFLLTKRHEDGGQAVTRPRIGVALGSGIARGWAHIGVLKALDDAGIRPDIVCGTSIGAVVGASYVAGKLDPLEQWAKGVTSFGILRYLDIRLGSGGLIAGKRLRALLRENFRNLQVGDLDRAFASVATDLATGHEVWLRDGNLVSAIMASYALPGVFPPVKVEGRWLIDGALVNPVPVSVCRALGARLVIAVNLNADAFGKPDIATDGEELLHELDEATRESGSLFDRVKPSNLVMRQLFGHGKNAPSMVSNMVAALNIVQDRLSRSRLAGDPPDVTVSPRLGHIGLLEFENAEECIEEGRRAMENALPFLNDALAVLSDWPGPNPYPD